MKNKNIYISLIPLLLTGCSFIGGGSHNNDSSTSRGTSTYTVTWKDYDDKVLQVDNNVELGATVEYHGETPTREGVGYIYTFNGWSPEVGPIYQDTIYVAQYNQAYVNYHVKFVNYDGELLDEYPMIVYGATPTYRGHTPVKVDDEDCYYTFNGWEPSLAPATSDTTYTAKFTAVPIDKEQQKIDYGMTPVFSQDGKTVKYGLYPKTHINDEDIIYALENYASSLDDKFCQYQGVQYVRALIPSSLVRGARYDDGVKVGDGTFDWFKCEPVEWQILKEEEDSFLLLSKDIISASEFSEWTNDYKDSYIKTFISITMYEDLFRFNDEKVKNTLSELGKIFLLDKSSYLNSDYGFDTSSSGPTSTREARATDFARGMGTYYQIDDSNCYGRYWTRSNSLGEEFKVDTIDVNGTIIEHQTDDYCVGIRPAIYLYK